WLAIAARDGTVPRRLLRLRGFWAGGRRGACALDALPDAVGAERSLAGALASSNARHGFQGGGAEDPLGAGPLGPRGAERVARGATRRRLRVAGLYPSSSISQWAAAILVRSSR